MYISVAGQPNKNLGPTGKKFVADFGKQIGTDPNPYSAYAAQTMDVLLTAVATSGGSRAATAANLFKTNVTDGILGNFSINQNGDTNNNPVTQYKLVGKNGVPYKVIIPQASLVKVS